MYHIGLINVVMITPDDIELVIGHSDVRRKFIDICISQTDRVYLNTLNEYQKTLEQRNSQLKLFSRHKHFDEIIIESYNSKLIPAANYIHKKRSEILAILNESFTTIYSELTSNNESLNFKYSSQLNDQDYSELLKDSIQKDLVLERTTIGVHKDDIVFEIGDYPLKKFGSQGQSKAFIIAFKLSQFKLFNQLLGSKPILLLDDMFEKIDENKAQKLIDLLDSEEFGQIIITDTHSDRVKKHFENGKKNIKFVDL
ncbi:MAG: DNA replication and repair protein RecF [Bacteroidia bacterium]